MLRNTYASQTKDAYDSMEAALGLPRLSASTLDRIRDTKTRTLRGAWRPVETGAFRLHSIKVTDPLSGLAQAFANAANEYQSECSHIVSGNGNEAQCEKCGITLDEFLGC